MYRTKPPWHVVEKISSRLGLAAFGRCLTQLAKGRRGNVTVLMAFLLPALLGALGLGFEVANWYMTTRAMQNAADSAAIAAATNGGSNYDVEAMAVAAQYGYLDGSNNVTVTASDTAACPSGGNTCYSVTINTLVPIFLAEIVGYNGDATVAGVHNKRLTATAVAQPSTTPVPYCMLALASSGAQGIRTAGAASANMAGCSIMSNTTATCSGHNLGADIGDAHGTNKGCGVTKHSNVPVVADPYAGLAGNIPKNTCGSYPQEPAKPKDPALPAGNQWSGSKTLSGNVIACGDQQLTGNVTINAPAGAVMVIENGQLDTNGFTLTTSSGSALTVVFSGDNSGSHTHAPTGTGTLDIAAPTAGSWSGVAIYQDPKLTSGVDVSAAGNSPAWDISGLVYLPHANVTLSGAVNKASNGQSCFALVADNVTVNGTGNILSHGGCPAAGLSMPTGVDPGRAQLVF
jgi:Flp pilus assembly protein TadG